jgi:DnaK suppressor protein
VQSVVPDSPVVDPRSRGRPNAQAAWRDTPGGSSRRKFRRNFNDMVTMAEIGERLAAERKIHILRRDSIPGASASMSMKPLLPPDYRPSDNEPFMNPMQQEYFRQKLLSWRIELLQESNETLLHLQEESLSEPDIADRASLETDRSLELRTRDRERKLIAKIDDALHRLEEGSYGFCEETSEPISLRRLEARPIATLSIEAQERHERMERTHRDD